MRHLTLSAKTNSSHFSLTLFSEVFIPLGDREGLGVFISLDITTATPVIAAVARNPDETKPSIIYF